MAGVVVSFTQIPIASLGETMNDIYENLNLPEVISGRFSAGAAMVTVVVMVLATQLAAIFSTLRLYRMKVVEALVAEE